RGLEPARVRHDATAPVEDDGGIAAGLNLRLDHASDGLPSACGALMSRPPSHGSKQRMDQFPTTDAQPDSLCLLRTSAIGDVTHVVPLVRTLQARWPQTRLTW